MEPKFKADKHYEERIIQALIVDHKFAEQMVEVLDFNYFNIEYLKEVASILFGYYDKYRAFPSFKLLGTLVREEENDLLRENMMAYMVKIHKDPLNGDLEYVKEESLDFCKKRALARALEASLNLIDEKKYDQIVKVIEKAVLAGSDRDVGHLFVDDFEKRMAVEQRSVIATPWDEINKILDGGVSGGELCIMCAPTSVGKSHSLVDIGYAAVKQGLTVVHYTFELDVLKTGKRYDSRISGINFSDLLKYKDEVWSAISSVPGKLVIKAYPMKSATTLTIKNHLQQLAFRDIRPDLLVVDYGDLMRSQHHYDQKRLEEESIYEDLRALAQELEVPIWTATQTNREGSTAEVVTLQHIAECFGKAMISDLFITMARKKEDNFSNTGNFFVAKSRLGPDGMKFPIFINTATSTIEVLSAQSLDDDEEGGDDKERLKKKFREFMEKSTTGQEE